MYTFQDASLILIAGIIFAGFMFLVTYPWFDLFFKKGQFNMLKDAFQLSIIMQLTVGVTVVIILGFQYLLNTFIGG